jgi:hypothetical protein
MDQEKQTILSRFDDYGRELQRDHEAQVERIKREFLAKVKAVQDREEEARAEVLRDREQVEAMRMSLE